MNTRTILLLSTDPTVEHVADHAVSGLKQRLHVVSSCREAMRRLTDSAAVTDLAIIDLDPGMHGVTLLNATSDRLPVLALTSLEQEYMEPIALRRGAAACLEKPITAERLREAIVRALRTHGSADALPS